MYKRQGGCHGQIAEETKAYHRAQAAKYTQYGVIGKTGLIAGFSYLGFKALTDSYSEIASEATGDISVGEIHATKSDADPTGLGEGGVVGDATGSQNINIGSGIVASDQGQAVNGGIDKNINTGFGTKSTSNQDQNRDPNRIDDGGDGAGNETSLF